MGHGKFIAFEGISGSGKSIVCKSVFDQLFKEGIKVIHTHEPTEYETGKFLRQVLMKKEETKEDGYRDTELFFADRIEHNKLLIKPFLEDGTNVLSDRYYLSTFGYQMTQGVNLNYLLEKTSFLINDGVIEKPDLVLFFDVSVETAIERMKQTGKNLEKFERSDFLSKLKQNYVEVQKIVDDNIVVIDAEQSLPTVIDSAYKEIKKILAPK